MQRYGILVWAAALTVLGGAAFAQGTDAPTTANGRPVSITPGNNSGALNPGTTADRTAPETPGGRVLPGLTANTPLQRNPSNTTDPTPPAVTTSNADSKTAAAPVKGANSFTMDEARRRIEQGGFSQVTGLEKDRDGIWRGSAVRNGTPVPVYCDYQGNVGAS